MRSFSHKFLVSFCYMLIFAGVDFLRYVPPGSGASASAAGTTTPKVTTGYFSGLRVHKDGEDVKSSGEEMLPSRAEMSATVKAAARAAAARLAADKKPSSASAGGGGGGGGASARGPGMEGGGAKIERDIFAKRPSRGQALGVASGGYDVYPETGDFETYDSDEVGMIFCLSFVVAMDYSVFFFLLMEQSSRAFVSG